MGPQRNTVPLRRAWDSGPERMAEFATINPWLPYYLIYQMLCKCGDANKHSHTNRDTAEDSEINASETAARRRRALRFTLKCLHVLTAFHERYFHIFRWVVSICFRNVLRFFADRAFYQSCARWEDKSQGCECDCSTEYMIWIGYIMKTKACCCSTKQHWHGLPSPVASDFAFLYPQTVDLFLYIRPENLCASTSTFLDTFDRVDLHSWGPIIAEGGGGMFNFKLLLQY